MPDDPRTANDQPRRGSPLRLTSPQMDSLTKRPAGPGKAKKARDDANEELLGAFETMSRRINDLARELKCLGYFDDEDDRPRAA
jgi:hypothetical protein